MVLLNGSCRQARDANAVAAHFQELRFAVFVQERGVHGLAVFGAQIKHVAHFNAALNGQRTFAIGRCVAGHHIAQVGHHHGLGQITTPVDTGDVMIGLVGAANPIGHDCHFAIGHHIQRLLQIQGA